jgi:hypothetical protein
MEIHEIQVKQKIDKFKKICYIHIAFQFFIIINFLINQLNYDTYFNAKNILEKYFPITEAANKDILPILRASIFLSCRFVIPISFLILLWKIIYNIRYLKFFDGNVIWFNNFLFYLLYSLITPLICSMISDKNNYFYIYFEYALIYITSILGFPILLIMLIAAATCLFNLIGSRSEVGRSQEGNTIIIYYENNQTEDIQCGGCYSKIVKFTYKTLVIFGIGVYLMILIGFNDIPTKILLILEGGFNIFCFINIKKTQNFLKKYNNQIEENLC